MRQYRQLTQEDRIEIYAMKQAGTNQTEIAQHLGVHRSTISRELVRNTGQRGYRPQQAQRGAVARRFAVVMPHLSAFVNNRCLSDGNLAPEKNKNCSQERNKLLNKGRRNRGALYNGDNVSQRFSWARLSGKCWIK